MENWHNPPRQGPCEALYCKGNQGRPLMTESIVAYTSIDAKREDELNEWMFTQAIKLVLIGGLISIPGAALGFMNPGVGVTRGDAALENVVNTHKVIWTQVIHVGSAVIDKVGEITNEKG